MTESPSPFLAAPQLTDEQYAGLAAEFARVFGENAHAHRIVILPKDERAELADVLHQIAVHDRDYDLRYPLVFHAVHLALGLGYAAGVRVDPVEPEWPVVYIELPTGQVSWHMPQHPVEFDGHSTGEKLIRVDRFRHGSNTHYSDRRPGGGR